MSSLHQDDILDRMEPIGDDGRSTHSDDEQNKDRCAICLHEWEDKSVLETCQHAYCFKCLLQWAEVSRRCPLCIRQFESCIHLIESDTDYTVYRFEADQEGQLGSSSSSSTQAAAQQSSASHGIIRRLYGPPQLRPRFPHLARRGHYRRQPPETADERNVAEQQRKALEKRVYIYQHGLYVKHMGANRISRYQQITPETFQVFPARLDRLVPWIRRDLQAISWLLRSGGAAAGGRREGEEGGNESTSSSRSTSGEADENDLSSDEFAPGLEVVREYILAVMKQYDLQTDQAMDLLRGFLSGYTEHFVHELMAYARSPLSVAAYDQEAQYGSTTGFLSQYPRSSLSSLSSSSRSSSSSRHHPRESSQRSSRHAGNDDRRKRRWRRSSMSEEDNHRNTIVLNDRSDSSSSRRMRRSTSREASRENTALMTSVENPCLGTPSSLSSASMSSSTEKLDRVEYMQRIIREKLEREQAIYNRNHPPSTE